MKRLKGEPRPKAVTRKRIARGPKKPLSSGGTWGVMDADGQWVVYRVSEALARKYWEHDKSAWRLCSDIEEYGGGGYEKVVEERPENDGRGGMELSKGGKRRAEVRQRLLSLSEGDRVEMLAQVYEQIWRLDAEDYPDAEVSGSDVIDNVSAIFAERRISPKEIK